MKKLPVIVAFALAMQNEFSHNQEKEKERILKEWENSKNYPRKKKKRVRKELLIEWSFANYNPFEI